MTHHDKYVKLYEKMSLLEIATILKYPTARKFFRKDKKAITGVQYKKVYPAVLEEKYPFDKIDWEGEFFSDFEVLKKSPPKKLVEQVGGNLKFESGIEVHNWDSFIDSFTQVRNNLTHGAKFFKGNKYNLTLDDRDEQLINAALAFIKFLEDNKLVEGLY